MIEDIEKIQLYLSDRRKTGMADKIESNLIGRYKRNIEWSLLSPEDKQNKRKSILKSVTKYLEEDGIAAFPYENAVVGFYEAGLELQKILTDKKAKEDILLLRLSILIQIDMDAIDSDSTLHNKMITPLLVYDHLRKELLAAGNYPEQMDRLIACVKVLNPVMEIPNA
jgi:hypothetical protein